MAHCPHCRTEISIDREPLYEQVNCSDFRLVAIRITASCECTTYDRDFGCDEEGVSDDAEQVVLDVHQELAAENADERCPDTMPPSAPVLPVLGTGRAA